MTEVQEIADAIIDSFQQGDDNTLNALDRMADQICNIANAIAPITAIAGEDALGGHVTSLTEAVMGTTAGLVSIAAAITELADAVRLHST